MRENNSESMKAQQSVAPEFERAGTVDNTANKVGKPTKRRNQEGRASREPGERGRKESRDAERTGHTEGWGKSIRAGAQGKRARKPGKMQMSANDAKRIQLEIHNNEHGSGSKKRSLTDKRESCDDRL